MRIIIQRVLEGKVTVGDQTVGSVGKGLMLLVGLSPKDTDAVAYKYAEKILNLRLWDEVMAAGVPADKAPRRWHSNLTCRPKNQFTLYAKMKGNKPDFHGAMEGDQARILFDKFVAKLRSSYTPERVQTGAFGEYMNVHIVNDGPVTIIWDSDKDDVEEEPGVSKETGKQQKQKGEGNKQPKQKQPVETVMTEKGEESGVNSETTTLEPPVDKPTP